MFIKTYFSFNFDYSNIICCFLVTWKSRMNNHSGYFWCKQPNYVLQANRYTCRRSYNQRNRLFYFFFLQIENKSLLTFLKFYFELNFFNELCRNERIKQFLYSLSERTGILDWRQKEICEVLEGNAVLRCNDIAGLLIFIFIVRS